VQIVGPLPGELENWLLNTAGVSAAAKEPDAAKALVKYLVTPEAAVVIKARVWSLSLGDRARLVKRLQHTTGRRVTLGASIP
jgi:molybdate transport system substrate-binding protein